MSANTINETAFNLPAYCKLSCMTLNIQMLRAWFYCMAWFSNLMISSSSTHTGTSVGSTTKAVSVVRGHTSVDYLSSFSISNAKYVSNPIYITLSAHSKHYPTGNIKNILVSNLLSQCHNRIPSFLCTCSLESLVWWNNSTLGHMHYGRGVVVYAVHVNGNSLMSLFENDIN